MNGEDIQKLLDNPNPVGAVKLPPGEFEGAFSINRPCVVSGSNTTLWLRGGTVMDIRSKGVTLKDIQLEITGGGNGLAVSCKAPDTVFENVTVCGEVIGIPGEDGHWDIPKMLSVGNILPDTPFTALAEVYVPTETKLSVNVSGMNIEPSLLAPGMNTVKITAEPLTEGTVIYGDIIFQSNFIRRAYVTLSASSCGSPAQSGGYYFRASQQPVQPPPAQARPQARPAPAPAPMPQTAPGISVPAPQKSVPVSADGITQMVRGQRTGVNDIFGDSEIAAELRYDSSDKPLDIDGYAFLLNRSGIAESDKSLVFFGNDSGADGAVKYVDTGSRRAFKLELDRIPECVDRIALAFSIYGEDPSENFSRVHGAVLIMKSASRTAEFRMDGFFLEKTIVAVEFYRKNDSWKVSAVGQGYAKGLRRLCESYGLNIV